MPRSEERNPYQLSFAHLDESGLSTAQPEMVYHLSPVKWEHGSTVGVFEVPRELRVQARSPADVYTIASTGFFRDFDAIDHEQLWTLLADTKNFITHQCLVYKSNLNTVVVRVAEVLREAVRFNAAGIIVVHNHPSGDPSPSPEDVRVTEMLIEAGKLLDISVLDHVVVGRQKYVSLKERGLGFKEERAPYIVTGQGVVSALEKGVESGKYFNPSDYLDHMALSLPELEPEFEQVATQLSGRNELSLESELHDLPSGADDYPF